MHGIAYPRVTKHQIGQKFVWPGINRDITHLARTCLQCQRKCSPEELVYGVPLRLLGEFLENLDPTENTETFVIALRKRIQQLRP